MAISARLPKGLGAPPVGGQPLPWYPSTHWLPPGYWAYDYILGAIVALLIVGLANLQLPMPGVRLQRAVRGLAGTRFGLYLLHYPLLNFFAAVVPGPPDEAIHRLLVFGLARAARSRWSALSSRVKGR